MYIILCYNILYIYIYIFGIDNNNTKAQNKFKRTNLKQINHLTQFIRINIFNTIRWYLSCSNVGQNINGI